MAEGQAAHFSKKILLISIFFLLINMAWYALFVFVNIKTEYKTVAPKLIFRDSDDIRIKTSYDTEYHSALSGQQLLSGTWIQTGEFEFAEIVLEKNIVRMDQDTEILFLENNFPEYSSYGSSMPRMVLQLNKGSIWINAFDGIEIRTNRSITDFSHSIGIMAYAEPMNRVMVITGSADLELNDENGIKLADFMIPPQNQVTYVDDQIIESYAQLKSSKLKKELKLSGITEAILADEWVVRNSRVDSNILKSQIQQKIIKSRSSYSLRSFYYKIKNLLTFTAGSKKNLAIEHAAAIVGYIMGAPDADTEKIKETEELLNELTVLKEGIKDDPKIKKLFTEAFFSIGAIDSGSSLWPAREYFLDFMLNYDGPGVLRAYLKSIRDYLYISTSSSVKSAEKVIENWFNKWENLNADEKDLNEFISQVQILKSTILNYKNNVSQDILDVFDLSGEKILDLYTENGKSEEDYEEMLFNITEERLDIAFALASAYRYGLAKQYLINSYASLKIDELDTKLAARQIFIERAKLLVQRIKFAEEIMDSQKKPIDETEFRDYYLRKVRDDLILEDLMEILIGKKESNEETSIPSEDDVITRFAESRIEVAEQDIIRKENVTFTFDIKRARLMDRDSDGNTISFSATYDIVANAVDNITLDDGKPLKGRFILDDLVIALLQKNVDIENTEKTETDISDLIIDPTAKEKRLREEIAAQNMAKQLVLNELAQADVHLAGIDNIEITDPVTLTGFYIQEAFVRGDGPGDIFTVQFKYSSSSKKVSDINILEPPKALAYVITLDQLAAVVIDTANKEIAKIEAQKEIIEKITKQNLILDEGDLSVDDSLEKINFKNLTLKTIPLKVDGIYSISEDKFLFLSHPLFSAENMEPEDYFKELVSRFIIDYLGQNGIMIQPAQIVTDFPFSSIMVVNYQIGKRMFSFIVDINGGKLRDVTLTDTGEKAAVMTFDEFKAIKPSPPAAKPKPKVPVVTPEEEPETGSFGDENTEAETQPATPKLPAIPESG